eukprot:TRINITY_DN15099_c0_g1_i4.p1 TRINITY_DN15099_c0_g1~~TRINITY_DN15099_c0_g1_i4.p1  ORF type:complete len:226 (-),score=73.01 TRINITY_DN15099_c0_g1_i4:381-1034(-)
MGEDTSRTLMSMTTDTQSRIDQLIADRAILRQKVEDSKYSGSGQLGSRRIVDEFETHLTEAKNQLEKAQNHYEGTSKQLISIRAGIEHLAEKLSGYRPEMQPPASTEDNAVDVLKHCETKLQMLLEEVNQNEIDELATQDRQSGAAELPQHNVRVKVSDMHDDEEEDKLHRGDGKGDVEDAEDDPHDRVALKQMSISAVERENKKARKRRNKEGEGS